MQQRPSTSEQPPEGDDHDPLTPGLPNSVKRRRSAAWAEYVTGPHGQRAMSVGWVYTT